MMQVIRDEEAAWSAGSLGSSVVRRGGPADRQLWNGPSNSAHEHKLRDGCLIVKVQHGVFHT